MGKQLIRKLLPMLDKMNWPDTPVATAKGQQAFEIGMEKIDNAPNDPQAIAHAIRVFLSGDSLPYALAGVAYALVYASREKNGAFAPEGLEAAMEWLEKAQELEPDLVDINVIEALIYIYSDRFDDARLILDYLQGQEPTNHYLHLAEIQYWYNQRNLEQTVHWFEQAAISAITVPQRLRLSARLGDVYMEFKQPQKAVEAYREAIHFNKDNHLLWYKLAVAYWQQEDYAEAERCVDQVLRIKSDFALGLKLKQALQKKQSSGVLGRLFGK